jgi:(S)-sulfolactate dehydrogenase
VPDIVISEFMDEAAVEHLKRTYDVHFDPTLVEFPDRLPDAVSSASALIVRNRTQVTSALLGAGQRLRCIGRLGVGLDNIDVATCRERDIQVLPATGANDVSVAEYVVGTMLSLLRGAYGCSEEVASGGWPRLRMIGCEAAGRRMGLIGLGATACEVVKRALAFGMTAQAYDPFLPADAPAWNSVDRVDLDAIFADSDVITIHVPLTAQTRAMVGRTAFRAMKKSAIFINASRGGVVDEPALAEALTENRIAGAAVDVFEKEPLSAADGHRFAGLKNVILTPHIAGLTEESNVRVSWLVARKVDETLRNHRSLAASAS